MLKSNDIDNLNEIVTENISIHRHQLSKRIVVVELHSDLVSLFFKKIAEMSVRDLEFIPYNRYLLANELNTVLNNLGKNLFVNILKSYHLGAILISIKQYAPSRDEMIKFATAFAHLFGKPNDDLLSGKYYATFTVENNPNANINLLRPYENFTMHTDGAFMNEPTEWILFSKLEEENVKGGETKLLHMDDWEEFDYFYAQKESSTKIKFSGPPPSDDRSKSWGNHRVADTLYSTILSKKDVCKKIRFVDQFIQPASIEEAEFVARIQSSVENSKNIIETPLLVGEMLIINNVHWMHGRNKFIAHAQLRRELMRQRGAFYE